eukprot:TRINITY_DN2952_c0_g1_i1.p1 TRINITY_DN2952_c0_g1~~TRINITY_DN2952_c0_g1_i1.p1  ORF type:complete len:941 (+),score=268.76 TRINITY_DN2952_c0_g1_i1:48-2870(+)
MDSTTKRPFKIEYAASGRSTCKGCSNPIKQDSLRLGKMVQSNKFDGEFPVWHHWDCFFKSWSKLAYDVGLFSGFNKLRWADQQKLQEKIEETHGKGKKRAAEEELDGKVVKKQKLNDEEDEEYKKALAEENKLLWDLKDKLKKVENDTLRYMLELNDQPTHGGVQKLVDRCAAGMLFGATPKCPECSDGDLVCLDGEEYACTGSTAWSKCLFKSKDIKRTEWLMPDAEELDDKWLAKFKFKQHKMLKKIIPKLPEDFDKNFKKSSSTVNNNNNNSNPQTQDSEMEVEVKFEDKPLDRIFEDQVFAIVGKLSKPREEVKNLIRKYGGQYSTSIERHVSHVIADMKILFEQNKPAKFKAAVQFNIPMYKEQYIYDSIKEGKAGEQKKYTFFGKPRQWLPASEPIKLVVEEDKPAEKPKLKRGASSKANLQKKWEAGEGDEGEGDPTKKKLKIKGNSAVDPDSGRDEDCHVLEEKTDIFNVMLNLTDIMKGTNSYYALQLLEEDNGNKWYVFRKWGRVGTTIGGNKLEAFSTKAAAKKNFEKLYYEKTLNEWSNRKKFVKQPGKFYPIELDFGMKKEDEEIKEKEFDKSKSKLDQRLASLIELMFDTKAMKRALIEMEIDVQQMPLGKLSKNHLMEGYKVLTEIQELIKLGNAPKAKFVDATNRFYTLIPHSFGMDNPTIIDSQEQLQEKVDLIYSLLEMEIATTLLRSADDDTDDPLESHYKKLNCAMEPLDHDSDEFQMIKEYVKNTHAPTHTDYTLKLQEVFKVDRANESANYKKYDKLKNKMLLWHGSRLTNYVGILSQGLRIAPPEAPVTGYMFGKGLYFADLVSKSANYCHASKDSPVALMLLAEVALGEMYELKKAKYMDKPPKGYDSTKGVGTTVPDESSTKIIDGEVVVPYGKCVKSEAVKKSELLYNEFIVYDTAQVKLKYLLQVEFTFKKKK